MNTIDLAEKIREDCIIATNKARASHIGSMFSIADILAVLYGETLRQNKKGTDVFYDKFILSKGHAGLAVYSALAEIGVLNKEELLSTYYQDGSKFSGHVSKTGNAGIELSTGSLGQGVCAGVGMALARKLDKSDSKVFVLVGNGECNEGSVWEAVMLASAKKLDNFTIIIDDNHLQCMGDSKKIIDMSNMAERFSAFGFETIEIDGHNHKQIKLALNKKHSLPLAIIAKTIKGKGVKMMENNNDYHAKYVKDEELDSVLAELRGRA
ncbi:MAG: transketolase [Clostridia bacterium]|nr:transketolase [Clostridia bacterium]